MNTINAVLNSLREITLLSVSIRMTLAVLCGGIIGIEREFRRRPAGFRTHILICLGAAMTTLTSQYLLLIMHYYTDVARLGAQVIAGIGFIGAGTIIVTRRQKVKGLTTAAGLWTSAIIGLCFGCGFYEGGLIATVLLLVTELFFTRIEYYLMRKMPEVNLYMEYSNKLCLENVLSLYREYNIKVLSVEITRQAGNENHNTCAVLSLRLNKKTTLEWLIMQMYAADGMVLVEEV